MNTGASSGGVRLSAGHSADESSWQTAPASRTRRGAASNDGTNLSSVSSAFGNTITSATQSVDKVVYNYSNNRPVTSSAVHTASSAWGVPNARDPRTGRADTNRKFPKVKAFKNDEQEKEDQDIFKATVHMDDGKAHKVIDPEWEDSGDENWSDEDIP
jgi:hypothetical protein